MRKRRDNQELSVTNPASCLEIRNPSQPQGSLREQSRTWPTFAEPLRAF